MFKRSLLIAGLLVSTAAFGQSVGEKTGANSLLGVAPKTADFVMEAALSDMTEIETSKLALTRGSAGQKAFAQQMIDAHTKTSAELKAEVSKGAVSVPVPAVLDDAHKSKVDKLAASNDFPADYSSLQVSAHKDAVSLFERYAKGGENAGLKAWAAKTLPDLQHHLEMAQKLPTK
jgi:putative membrane protein